MTELEKLLQDLTKGLQADNQQLFQKSFDDIDKIEDPVVKAQLKGLMSDIVEAKTDPKKLEALKTVAINLQNGR